jgi:hypothetical protein
MPKKDVFKPIQQWSITLINGIYIGNVKAKCYAEALAAAICLAAKTDHKPGRLVIAPMRGEQLGPFQVQIGVSPKNWRTIRYFASRVEAEQYMASKTHPEKYRINVGN